MFRVVEVSGKDVECVGSRGSVSSSKQASLSDLIMPGVHRHAGRILAS